MNDPNLPLGPDAPDSIAGDADLGEVFAALLRRPAAVTERFRAGGDVGIRLRLAGIALLGLTVYGLIVGSYSGGDQWWAAPLKTAAIGLLACAFCAPSLFIFYCLGEGPARIGAVLRSMLAMAAVCSILLLGFAPVLWIFSQSTESVAFAGLIHLGLLSVCLGFAVGQLGRALTVLGMKHGGYLVLWGAIFFLTVFQLTTALRPTLGTSPSLFTAEKKFFLEHWGETIVGNPGASTARD